MPDQAHDHFDRYFAEKLWTMIPEYYRDQDGLANPPGVLRGFIEVLAQQAATLRRSNDRLWDDQFIDLCSEWAVPYIGQLVGTRMVSALNRRGRRIDVAKTIYYRRRAGTPRVLEELIADITGWDGKLVEEFRRLGRMRHGLDPKLAQFAGTLTGTMPGGWADLRSVRGAELADTPFDEYFHTPDFRQPNPNGAGLSGRYGIAKLGFHLYWLASTLVEGVTPCKVTGSTTQFTFDPSGRDIPLFIQPYRTNDNAVTNWEQWTSAEEWQVPSPMSCRLLNDDTAKLSLLPDADANTASIMLETYDGTKWNPIPSDKIVAGNLSGWPILGMISGKEWLIDPALGRLLRVGSDTQYDTPLQVSYHYGFSSNIGAGGYDRSESLAETPAGEVVLISDSATYNSLPAFTSPIEQLEIRAADRQRPYFNLTGDLIFTADVTPSLNPDELPQLTLNGLWIGADAPSSIQLFGNFTTVTLQNMTLDPGGKDSSGNPIAAVTLEIHGDVENLVIHNSIVGPIVVVAGGLIENIMISDSIVDGSSDTANPAIDIPSGHVTMRRVTVFGGVDVEWLDASETIITSVANVVNTQQGCFRFSAVLDSDGGVKSRVPHAFESNRVSSFSGMFTSRTFGEPGYAQLAENSPQFLQRGAENGSEVGAFSSLMNPIKFDSLKAKIDEYAPFGLLPVYIFET